MSENTADKRSISEKDFSSFLEMLSPDPDVAGARYERLRGKLILFFLGRELSMADMLADEAIDRLSRRLAEGQVVASAEAYVLGIARHVAQEESRRERNTVRLENQELWNISQLFDTSTEEDEERVEAVDSCMQELSREDRELLQRYYAGDRGDRIRGRQSLARLLQLSPNALRKRAFRLRAMVESCARRKLGLRIDPSRASKPS